MGRRGAPANVPAVTLYTSPYSHYCQCADRTLAFKGVRFDTVYVPYHNHQEVLRVSNQDYIPLLMWDGQAIPWQEIPDFLEKAVPKPTLYPWNQRGLAHVLDNWGHLVLEERVWRAVVTRVPPILRSDEERWVFEEMQTRARGPWHVLQSREPEFRAEMLTYLGKVEAILDGRPWILAEPSLADFGIYGSISPLLTVGDSIPEQFPNLRRWAKQIRALA
jgi:glutathione S-transferase